MICKVKIIKTVAALENGLHYIGNEKHPDHADIDIGPEIRIGIDPALTTEDFCKEWVKGIENEKRVIRRGRKRTRLAVLEIVRSPDGTDMTAEEEQAFLQTIHAAQGGAAAIVRRHYNRITKATDFHVYRFKRWGREENPLLQLRVVADAAHEELNAARSLAGGKHVETIVEVRRRKRKERGVKELAEQLQEIPGLTEKNLQESIEKLGHKVTRFNVKGDTISVQHPGSKRAHRYSISGLFEHMAELKSSMSPPRPAPTPEPQFVLTPPQPGSPPPAPPVKLPSKVDDWDMDI